MGGLAHESLDYTSRKQAHHARNVRGQEIYGRATGTARSNWGTGAYFFSAPFCLAQRFFCALEIALRAAADIFRRRRFFPPAFGLPGPRLPAERPRFAPLPPPAVSDAIALLTLSSCFSSCASARLRPETITCNP